MLVGTWLVAVERRQGLDALCAGKGLQLANDQTSDVGEQTS